MNARCTLLLFGVVIAGLTARAEDQGLTQVDVFVSGTEGYHTFRIPALVVTKKGSLLAFCEGRKTSRADHGDVDMVLKRSTDAGKTWSKLQLIHEEGGEQKITIGNPCPVVEAETGTIFLPFTRDNKDVLITQSTDDGVTWSKPAVVTAAVKKTDWTWYATGPGVGIQLAAGKHKGRLLIPCDHRESVEGKQPTFSHMVYSDDKGQTWKLGGTVAPHTNECQCIELADGSVLMNMRNYTGRDGKQPDKDKMRVVSLSKDGGLTWSELAFDKALVEPICQASIVRDQAGRVLFTNPASDAKRHQLTARLSEDEGKTWPKSKVLEEGPAAYSCLAILPGGDVGCLYERGTKDPYEKITFAKFNVDWLKR